MIELKRVGSILRITGKTYPHAQLFKEWGFKWNKEARAWEGSPTPDRLVTISETIRRLGGAVDLGDYPVAISPLRGKLRQYQREGVSFLHEARGRALLGDDPGLGKTIQTLVWLHETGARFLVVSPASVLHKWHAEAKGWLGLSDAETFVVKDSKVTIPDDRHGYFITYDLLRRNVKRLEALGHLDALILDECHYIKNPKASRTKAVQLLHKKLAFDYVIALSGTPFLNSPIELFPTLNLLYPYEFPNYFQFGIRYAGGTKTYWGWEFKRATNTNELKQRLRSFYIRRTKKEVLKELPEVQFIRLPIEGSVQKYREAKRELIHRLMEDSPTTIQIRDSIFQLYRLVGILKVPYVLELIEDLLQSESKLAVFAVHHDVISAFDKALDNLGNPGRIVITGQTPSRERYELVKRFAEEDSLRIALFTSALQEGVNLNAASNLILAERVWNKAREDQIISRLHRFGQDEQVDVYVPILQDTLDERIDRMIQHKGEQFARLFSLDTYPVTELLQFI